MGHNECMEPLRKLTLSDITSYANPFDIFHKEPIAFASDGKRTNGLTIGWGGLGVLWGKDTCTIYIHETRFSRGIFDGADYFSVCLLPDEYKDAIAYYGRASGRNEDKIANGGLNVIMGKAPYAEESRLVLICRKMGQSKFDPNSVDQGVREWYARSGVHTIYQGEIVEILGR